MLSKGKGQCLRVAVVMHILFQIAHETQVDDDDEISDEALKAAIDFVQTSIQHAAYISGDQLLLKKLRLLNMVCVRNNNTCHSDKCRLSNSHLYLVISFR